MSPVRSSRTDTYANGRLVSPRRLQKAAALAEFVRSQFAGHTDLSIVDFGCADGAIPVLLLRSSAGDAIRQITGITLLDYNDLPEKPAFEHPRFERLVGDLEGSLESLELPWGQCDLVLATAFLHYLERPEVALRHAHELLRPGGLLVAGMPHPLILRLRRHGLGVRLPPNNRIRQVRHLNWWQARAQACGFVEIERTAIQWVALPRTAGLERLLRRTGILGTFGSNILAVYCKRE